MLDLALSRYVSKEDDVSNAFETGFTDYDRHIFGLKRQEISLWVARNGEGKSTAASQSIAHNLKIGNKVYLYSGELSENKIQHWLYEQVVGKNTKWYETVETKFGPTRQVKKEAVYALKKWHSGKLFTFDRSTKKVKNNLEVLYADMIAAAKAGVGLYFVDNLMTTMEDNEHSRNADQANFIQWCKDFSVNYDCHVVILVHTNKSPEELDFTAKIGTIKKGDISGTMNIPNKADNILAIERMWKHLNSKDETLKLEAYPDCLFTSLKDRWEGGRKIMAYNFSLDTLRFYNNATKEFVNYGWEEFIEDGLDERVRQSKAKQPK